VAITGVRGLQIAAFRARLDRLPVATDVYDFSRERDDLQHRIAQLEAGRAVHVQAWELAHELLPQVGLKSGFDRSGPRCFCIEGEDLIRQREARWCGQAGRSVSLPAPIVLGRKILGERSGDLDEATPRGGQQLRRAVDDTAGPQMPVERHLDNRLTV